MKRAAGILPVLLLAGFCYASAQPGSAPAPAQPETAARVYGQAGPNVRPLTYSKQSVRKRKERDAFLEQYTAAQLDVILRINRIDRESLYKIDSLVVPEPLDTAFLTYSPFPEHLAWAGELGKMVIFSYRIQAFGAYSNGRLVRWGPTSMGRRTKLTPEGLYSANWKEAVHVSSIDPDWNMPYTVNLELNSGIAMHQYAMPGKPASHKCMRLQMPDAMWFFNWVDLPLSRQKGKRGAFGTPVVVFGKYDFNRPGPWHQLPKNPKATHYAAAALEQDLAPYLALIKERYLQRQLLLAPPEEISR